MSAQLKPKGTGRREVKGEERGGRRKNGGRCSAIVRCRAPCLPAPINWPPSPGCPISDKASLGGSFGRDPIILLRPIPHYSLTLPLQLPTTERPEAGREVHVVRKFWLLPLRPQPDPANDRLLDDHFTTLPLSTLHSHFSILETLRRDHSSRSSTRTIPRRALKTSLYAIRLVCRPPSRVSGTRDTREGKRCPLKHHLHARHQQSCGTGMRTCLHPPHSRPRTTADPASRCTVTMSHYGW